MPYTKVFNKTYPEGYKDRPDLSTPETAASLNAKDNAFEHIENYLLNQKTSDLENDSEFVTGNDVSEAIKGKADKSTTYTKTEVDELVPDNKEVLEDLSDSEGKLAYKGEVIGGGGNANERELTYAEYQALSEEEKMNGTNYFVTDYPSGSGGGAQDNDYSFDEKVIGKWVDGKPLYQKTWYVEGLTAGSKAIMTDVIVEDSDINFITNCFGIDEDGNVYYVGHSNVSNNYDMNITAFNLKTGRWWLIKGSNVVISSVYITVRYTKTTE